MIKNSDPGFALISSTLSDIPRSSSSSPTLPLRIKSPTDTEKLFLSLTISEISGISLPFSGIYNREIDRLPGLSPDKRAKPRPNSGKYFCFTLACRLRSSTVFPKIIRERINAISGAD